jgi:dipeptidyl aminopeptidase/acylaminoacyl peptidase
VVEGVRWYLVALLIASLAGASATPIGAAVPGNNGRIAFASLRDGNYELYSMQPDATDVTRLTRNPAADIHPAWSPDGRRIAFASDRAGNPDIHVLEADGSGVARLTTSNGADFAPSWAPDATRIAFISNRDGNDEIYVMSVDGTAQTRLTTAPGNDENPAWSPDGKTLAFASTRTGAFSIYAMNADGSNQRRLTLGAGPDVSPSWSPDGQRIAFASNRDGNYEIYVMNADGTGQRRLTRNLAADLDPSWSPDGKQIAFTSTRDVTYEIYVMSADGTDQTRLTTNEVEDTTASWESIPIPPPVVANASFRARWRESVLTGALELKGDVPMPVSVDIALTQGTRLRLTRKLELPAGSFTRAIRLPSNLPPGPYVLDVTPGTSSQAYSPQSVRLELRAPTEGVVRSAHASTHPGGVPLNRFPNGTAIVFAHFSFAAMPRPGRVLTVSWYRPGGKLAGPQRRKAASRLIVAYVGGRNGAPLPRGVWHTVLRAGPTVVKRVSFRVG